jgi:tetratricopeptide (TPR) repeat protein
MSNWSNASARCGASLRFDIPEPGFWVLLIAGAVFSPVVSLVGIAPVIVAAAGISNWRWYRHRCRGGLVVARLGEGGGTEGHGRESQEIIVDQLRHALPPGLEESVQPVPIVIGSGEGSRAARLQRRLQAGMVVYGRVMASADGGWTVLPRVLEPISGAFFHQDFETRDITPGTARFGPLVASLPPQRRVVDEEYPFDFCRDLEGVIRGTAGQFAAVREEYPRAEALLVDAIARAPNSTIPQFDVLRVSLADSIAAQGRSDGALALLRGRVNGSQPSAYLLRSFAHRVGGLATHANAVPNLQHRAEALSALRLAVRYEHDPARDMTVYNLLARLTGPDLTRKSIAEADMLADELLESDSGYRKLWWVKKAKAVILSLQADATLQSGDERRARELSRQSARWWDRSIRARPRLQLRWVGVRRGFARVVVFPPSVILHSHAWDAHTRAGHHVRSFWHRWLAGLLRSVFMRAGRRRFSQGDFAAATAWFGWAYLGRVEPRDQVAAIYLATAALQAGADAMADGFWTDANTMDREAALAVRDALQEASDDGSGIYLPRGVPGI